MPLYKRSLPCYNSPVSYTHLLGEGTHTEPPFVPKAVVAVDTASDALLGEPLQLYADRVDPVSYTHLDVYKRQLLYILHLLNTRSILYRKR